MTIIHLCAAAWRIYDLRKWRVLDRHRATCKDCYRKRLDD